MKVVKGLSSAVLLTLLLGSASAVYADEVQEYALDTMVVTATRVEQKAFDTQADITVITREDLEKKHYTDLGDALKDVPGVTLQNYGVTGENYSLTDCILMVPLT